MKSLQTETPAGVAEQIANDELLLSRERRYLADAIEVALLNERTRAARIIKEHRESDICKDNCWATITNLILGPSGKDGNSDVRRLVQR